MSGYPIIEQRALRPVLATKLRRARRSLSELPDQPPGCVLVASVDGTYTALHRRTLRDIDDVFVNAASIAVVDTRPKRRVVAELEVPSKSPVESFVLRVSFSCSVIDPIMVVRRVPDDLVPALESHLRANSELLKLGPRFAASDITRFRRTANAHVTAWCRGRPPEYDGMEVRFEELHVEVPRNLVQDAEAQRAHELAMLNAEREHKEAMLKAEREHKDAMLQKERSHTVEMQSGELDHELATLSEKRREELEEVKKHFSLKQAKLIEDVLARGPVAIEALYLELNDERYANSMDRAYGEQDRIEDRFRELINTLAQGGHFDRVAIDTPRLIDEFVARHLTQPEDRRTRGSASSGARSLVEGEDEPKRIVERTKSGLPESSDDPDAPNSTPEPADEDSLDG